MQEDQTLNLLCCGDTAIVAQLFTDGALRRRLTDLGLTPGAKVQCVLQSPAGDPCAYLIRGAVIALRKADCEKIHCSILPAARTARVLTPAIN